MAHHLSSRKGSVLLFVMTTFANNTFTNGLLFANKYPVRVRVRARDPGGVRVRVRVRARGLGGVRVRVRVRVRPIWWKVESAAERTVRLAAEHKAAKRQRETAQAAPRNP